MPPPKVNWSLFGGVRTGGERRRTKRERVIWGRRFVGHRETVRERGGTYGGWGWKKRRKRERI